MTERKNDLISAIKLEKNRNDSYDRYPIRFIFLPFSEKLSTYVISIASKLSLKLQKISDYLPLDKWVTWENLYGHIESEIKNSVSDLLFLGFSEYLRFQNKTTVESIFINLIELENTYKNRKDKRRVYFLMDSFENLFYTYVQQKHHRNIFYNPIISGENDIVLSEIKKTELIISNNIYSEIDNNNIKTVKDYLDLTTRTDSINFSKTIYCSSTTIINLSKKYNEFLDDTLFPYITISNLKMVIEKKIEGICLENEYSNDFLSWLSIGINMDTNVIKFEDFVIKKLGLTEFSIRALLFKYFSTSNENEKELLILAFGIFKKTNSLATYVYYLISNYKINTKLDFIKYIYLCVNDIFVLEKAYNDRKELIKLIKEEDGNIEAPEELIEIFSEELLKIIKTNIYINSNCNISIKENFDTFLISKTNSRDKVNEIYDIYKSNFLNKILTSESQIEKRIIIFMTSNNVFIEKELEFLYPELFGYLFYRSNSLKSNKYLDEYFIEYKKSKVLNRPTDNYFKLVNEYSLKNFLDFYNNIDYKNIDNEINAQHIFVLDGVGAEYLSLITFLLEKKHNIILSSTEYRKALLPTTTEVNKQLINILAPSPIWLYEFDNNIIHGEVYNFEKNIEKALSLLQKMIDEVVLKSNGESFLIIADHGSTVSHKIFKATKKYDCFPNVEHDGRCCKVINKDVIPLSSDYVIYNDREGKDWVLSINHISLKNTAKYEAHGGGTVEEIFIPFIYYKSKNEQIAYEIKVFKKEVSGLDKSIKFTVNPRVNPKEITIIEESGNITKPFISENIYICNLSVGKKQNITIKINEQEEIVTITSNSGINSGNGGFF